MEQGFDDLLFCEADVQCGAHVDPQLRLAATQRGQGPDSDELTAARVEPGPVVNVTEGESRDVVPQGGADVSEGIDNGFALVAVDAREDVLAVLAASKVLIGVDVVLGVVMAGGLPGRWRACTRSRRGRVGVG